MGELSIKITIANRVYPLTIQMEEEENIRKAAKLVEENIRSLESNYAVKDKQDLLAMTALQYATQSLEGKVNTTQDDSLVGRLMELDTKISNYLDKE